jgi:hypothetical protein
MRPALYLLGAPGVGKSTALAAWLSLHALRPLPVPVRLYGKLTAHRLADDHGEVTGLYLGTHREYFPGTDALSMGVAPDAYAWAHSLASQDQFSGPFGPIVGEGARLGIERFLRALSASTDLTVALLTAEPEMLTARRLARGSTQAPSWMAGAETRARRAFEAVEGEIHRAVRIDTSHLSPDDIARLL